MSDAQEQEEGPVVESTPWLDEEETSTWVSFVALMLLSLKPVEADLRRDGGLSLFEYMVLSQLSMAPDRSESMSRIAFLSNGSPSRLSNVISRFEKAGWVSRSPDPSDRRGAIARLTDEGFAIVERVAPDHVRSVRRHIIDRLTPEQGRVLREIAPLLVEGYCEEQRPSPA